MTRGELAGARALPLPTGDVAALRGAANRLRQAAGRARATDVVAGRVGPALEAVWAGTVASAATAEATVLGVRARALLDQLDRASLAVDRYADSLESITAATRRLQAQWDQAQLVHRRALDTAERQSALDPAHHARLVAHLQADHALVLTGLESRHEYGMAELRDAGAASARAIDAATTAALPQAAGTTAAAVRPDLIGGLCFAEGAARALQARDRASAAASQWRQLGPDPDSSAVEQWLGAHGIHVEDPLFAQAFIEEVGLESVLTTLTEVGRPGADASYESFHSLLGVVGGLVVSATAPGLSARVDPRTRRQVTLAAELARRDVIRSASTVITTADGHTRHTGYWLTGQLLVAARKSGFGSPLPQVFVRDLAAATAAAEIAETRDADGVRLHGTTMRIRGTELFASYFDDPTTTGDALHQLLSQAHDPAAQRELLAISLPHSTVRNSRGDNLVLAEYLVRRWITYQAGSQPRLRWCPWRRAPTSFA